MLQLQVLRAADSDDERFMAGLRERGLFDLAVTHCRQELASPTLSDTRRAMLVIELARVYAEQAVQSPVEEREALWNEAHQVTNEFLAQNPNHPRRLLVQLQGALVELARGELARQEAATLVDGSDQLKEAKTHLRLAMSQLETLRRTIDGRLRQPLRTAAPEKDELTKVELDALSKNVAFQLARAARNQAECYPAHSPDRANSLTHALELLDPLAELAVVDDLVWRSRIEQVVCYRLLGDSRAKEALENMAKNDPPPQIALRAQAETIRSLLAQKLFAEVAAQLEQENSIAGQASLDLDFARFEAQLALAAAASSAGRVDEANKWQQTAIEHAQSVGKTRGASWLRRTELLLANANREPVTVGESAAARQAARHYQEGKLEEALAAYDRAAKQARDAGETRQGFSLALAAAAIEEEQGRREASRDRYRKVALSAPNDSRAGEAHLQATLTAAGLARSASESERTALMETYDELLAEHLAHWPRGATASRVRLMLGELRSAQRHWKDAVDALSEVDPNEPEFLLALRVMFMAYQRWLMELPTEEDQAAKLVETGAKYFQRVAESGQVDESRMAAVFAARLRLGRLPDGNADAVSILTTALVKSDDAPQAWQFEARALLVRALANDGKLSQGSTELEQLASAPSEQLVALIGELAELTQRADPARRHELGGLTLRGISLLEKQEETLRAEDQAIIDNARISSLVAAGHSREAVRALDTLAKQQPLDGDRCETRARMLADIGDRASLARALTEWRAIENQCRAGSPRWFRARWGQADGYLRQALPEQAIRLIRLTAALHPEMGGAEMKTRFDQLRLACEQAR